MNRNAKFERQYSGMKSEPFWERVNSLDHGAYHDAAYMLGVALQDLEGRVLQFVENAEALLADRKRSRGGK